MAKDAELDRLKVAQDLAFNRKQTAYDAQDTSWKRRKAAGDKMHAAFEEKDAAYHAQQSAWEDLQRLRDSKGPRIGQLNDVQERAFQNMKSSYDSASSAYDRRDGLGAKSYADQGRAYKAESESYVEERRRLVAELRSAGDHQKSYAPAFQTAKGKFDSAKREFDAAKAAHERTQIEFKAAKAAFDKASSAFKSRLEFIHAERKLHTEKNKRLAERVGVPYQYLDKIMVRSTPDGGMNFYFGGVGLPNGPGHGHYATDRNGKVTYRREPFDPHGSHNFTDDPRWQRFDGGFAEVCTFEGKNAIKESGLDSSSGRQTINIYYGGAGGNPLGKGHGHVVYYQDSPNLVSFHRPPK